jgi:uncharacterized membrane protein YfcA
MLCGFGFSRQEIVLPALDSGLLLVLAAAFAAGLIDAMVGGGGLIQLPALFGVFSNTSPPVLLGTSKVSSICGTTSAVYRYAQRVAIPWRALLPLAALVLIAALGGAKLATVVSPDLFRPLVPIMLLTVLIYMVRRKDLGDQHAPRDFAGSHHVAGMTLLGAVGFYDGFFGPGTGSFLMFIFIRFYGYDFLHASAAARVLNVATNIAALSYFAFRGYVLWPLGAGMAVCSVAGSFIGTKLALRGGSALVRKIFIVVVSALILRTAWTAVFG